jgi:hypothetical protein
MKSVYLAAVVGVFAASAVNAQCACVPTDSACLSECGMFHYNKLNMKA